MSKIVKNQSTGYGYHYASLADFAKQNIEIPIMRTRCTDCGEFVEWKDKDGNWQQGARVVSVQSKSMNEAQAYGAGLTYARRYTVAMANGIATDDDDEIERAKPVAKKSFKLDFTEVRKKVKEIDDIGELSQYWESLNMTDAQQNALRGTFKDRQREIDELD